ncbi:MAG TPA: hypothetical protein DCY80_20430 [Solibacterales bacterium]|nr:hypothetical protein [Bryobacterales bacterium]
MSFAGAGRGRYANFGDYGDWRSHIRRAKALISMRLDHPTVSSAPRRGECGDCVSGPLPRILAFRELLRDTRGSVKIALVAGHEERCES